jgi:anti-sigma B factor antagonist
MSVPGSHVDEPLAIAAEDHGGTTVVSLSGMLDVSSAEAFKEALLAQLDDGARRTVVDFTGVRFVDSSGLNALVVVDKRYRSNAAELWLVIDDPKLLRLFEITRLDGHFRIFPALEDAAGEQAEEGVT